jgi:hypothetical protein
VGDRGETARGRVCGSAARCSRILFEQLQERLRAGALQAQRLLIPETVELPASQAALVLEHRAALAELGLEVEGFGGGTLLLSSYPALLGKRSPRSVFQAVIDYMLSKVPSAFGVNSSGAAFRCAWTGSPNGAAPSRHPPRLLRAAVSPIAAFQPFASLTGLSPRPRMRLFWGIPPAITSTVQVPGSVCDKDRPVGRQFHASIGRYEPCKLKDGRGRAWG